MKHVFATLVAVSAIASPALAGNLSDPVVTPDVSTPVTQAPVVSGSDWTGFYAGGQIGALNGEIDDLNADGDGTIYGLHAGYNYDLGNIVLGGEFDYDFADDIELESGGSTLATLEDVARLKLKAGYDAGPALIYATAGYAQAGVDVLDDKQDGTFYGAGVTYAATENVLIGGEILKHDFDDLDTLDVDGDATTFTLRGSYKF